MDVLWLGVLPLVTFLLSWLAPVVVFPAPPAAKCSSSDLLAHCKKLGNRYLPIAVLITIITLYASITLFDPPKLEVVGTSFDRIAYTLRLELFPALFYIVCIYRVALGRSLDPKAVQGERTGVSSSVEIASRVLQNTTEQLILGVLSHLALSTVLIPSRSALLPALVALWMSGRILFMFGYTPSNPMARELGFHLTMLPSIAAIALCSYFAMF